MLGTHDTMPSIGDLIYALAQWLKTTPLLDLANWMSNWPLREYVDAHFWFIPIAQTFHILAIAAAFGSVLMINLRVVELAGRNRTMAQIAHRYLPWIWWSLATLLASGIVMIVGEPVRELLNPCFWIKMILIVVAIAVSVWFQDSVRRNVVWWELTPERRIIIRAGAGGVVVLWLAIMAFGRWIAYAPI